MLGICSEVLICLVPSMLLEGNVGIKGPGYLANGLKLVCLYGDPHGVSKNTN